MVRVAVDRLGPGDVLQLATDVGPVPMNVGALLVLADEPSGPAPDDLAALVTERLGAVPRLRQVVVRAPVGLGAPYWADAVADPARHVAVRRCARGALLDEALAAVTAPLPADRPRWRAVVLDDGCRRGVVVVVHHVLADGVGALGLLARLVDGPTGGAAPGGSRPTARATAARPSLADLLADVVRTRTRTFRRLAGAVTTLRVRRAGSGPRAGRVRAPRCSLAVPTGPRRAAAPVTADLTAVRHAGHAHGATVNDVLLCAVGGALGTLLAERDERVDAVVASVPVARRPSRPDAADRLGNHVGVMPVPVPTTGTAAHRLARVADATARRKERVRRASVSLVGVAFRLLAALGLFRWAVDRQRLVTTFVTHVRGPARPVRLGGTEVSSIHPVTVTAGNVCVAFAALSYAGRLHVTVVTDPDVLPAAPVAGLLAAELATLVVPQPPYGSTGRPGTSTRTRNTAPASGSGSSRFSRDVVT